MRVLIAEDEPMTRLSLERTLAGWGYEPVTARDGDEAWAILQSSDAPRLAILDWLMPGMDGVDICAQLRSRAGTYTYVILLTGKDRREDLVGGLSAGADDYIIKPFDHKELEVRVRAGRRIVELQSELIAAREALRVQATTDALTGVLNRRAVTDRLKDELARAVRTSGDVSMLLLDVDHFKAVNDTHGHDAGDEVLRAIARVALQTVRAYDVVGRYGGEEFLIILPDCDKGQAFAAADRLRQQIAATVVPHKGAALSVTISAGLVSQRGSSVRDAESLVTAADDALYRAKRSGRNRVELGRAMERRSSLPAPPS